MRGVLVAIDLETTGLDTATAQIIEIGAVKFRDNQIIETYQTLVDPEIQIPPKITAITGITPDSLIGAPKLRDVQSNLKQFIGSSTLVGHNIDFDLRFLERAGAIDGNTAVDTYELASVLLPTTPRYNLNALMQELNLTPEGDYHRALADALATTRIYMTFWQRMMGEIPLELLQEIVTAAQALPWRGTAVFADAMQARLEKGEKINARWLPILPDGATSSAENRLVPREGKFTLIDVMRATADIQRAVDDYEQRETQREMLSAVSTAFNEDQHILIDATTGVGKTLAYLLPAVTWAIQNHERIVISVDSDSLQKQLLERELPRLRKALDVDFKAVVLKGRNSYLCPQRLEVLRRRLPTSVDELRVLSKVNVWLNEQSVGDISLRGPAEWSMWNRLSAAGEKCALTRCEHMMNGICPFYIARSAAEHAHVIIVNHSLLIADALETENAVLPPYTRLIVDEVHNLEDTVTRSLTTRLDPESIRRQMADLGTLKTGLLGDVIRSTQEAIPEKYFEQIKVNTANIAQTIKKMHYHIDNLFKDLKEFVTSTQNANTDYLVQVRLTDGLRNKPAFSSVKATWAILSQFIEGVGEAMSTMEANLSKLKERYSIAHIDDLLSGTNALVGQLHTIYKQLNAFIVEPDSNTIYWIELSVDNDYVAISNAPLSVGKLLRQAIWNTKKTVVMTSATLRTGASFEFIRQRLDAEPDRVQELALTHRNDYQECVMLYLPTDMPEPQERNKYNGAIERGLIELAAATDGRLLALFTGYTQLRQVAQNIAPRLALGNIAVFDQSDGTSRELLLEGFRSAERAVLLGTRNLWEEVDFTSDDLVALAIVRLPFAVPSDPVFAARSEQYNDPFNQYTVQDAIIRFRQGFDQLLRTRPQRSLAVLFDKRMTSKDYGQLFLDSLPICTVKRATMADVATTAKEWLSGS